MPSCNPNSGYAQNRKCDMPEICFQKDEKKDKNKERSGVPVGDGISQDVVDLKG